MGLVYLRESIANPVVFELHARRINDRFDASPLVNSIRVINTIYAFVYDRLLTRHVACGFYDARARNGTFYQWFLC